MEALSLPDYLLLFAATYAAGLLNATVGGGGLMQVPALLLLLPGVPIATIVGTAKLAGVPGLGGAVITYMRRYNPRWDIIRPVALASVPAALAGAAVATRLDPAWARPIILVLLTGMSAHVLLQPRFGEGAPGARRGGPLLPWVVGILFGLYEGFFGAGSGTVLVVIFVSLFGLDMVAAAIATTIVTFVGAGVALLFFLAAGRTIIPLGLLMIAFNLAGALTGARLVALRGNALLRRMLAAVLVFLIARLAWEWIL